MDFIGMIFTRKHSSKMNLAKRFLTIIVCLSCLLGTPCSSRPIVPPGDVSAGVGEKANNASASMVVRIIVSSSSSSSSADSDFSHFFPISTTTSSDKNNDNDDHDDLHEADLNGTRRNSPNTITSTSFNSNSNPENSVVVSSPSPSQSQSFLVDTTTKSHSSGEESTSTNINPSTRSTTNTNRNRVNNAKSRPAPVSTSVPVPVPAPASVSTSSTLPTPKPTPTFTSDSDLTKTSESDLAVTRTTTTSTPSTMRSTPTPTPTTISASTMTSSSSSLPSSPSSNLKYPFLSALPSTPNPVPTTYRPKSFRFRSSPLFLSLFLSSTTSTTTTTTTTIKPLPFREDIFSIFYRAFAESQDSLMPQSNSNSNSNPSQGSASSSSSTSFINNLQSQKHTIPKSSNYNNHKNDYEITTSLSNEQHQQQLPPELIMGGSGSSSRNVERFQILPSPRIVPSNRDKERDRNSYKNSNSHGNINPVNIPKDKLNDQDNDKDKIVTAVVTRSSSSTSATVIGSGSVTPINANYPRIRPSSVMMLRLRGSPLNSNSNDSATAAADDIIVIQHANGATKISNNNTDESTEDTENENIDNLRFELQYAPDFFENASGVADWSSKEKRKEWPALKLNFKTEDERVTDSSSIFQHTENANNKNDGNNGPGHSHIPQDTNVPQAEALIQIPTKNENPVSVQSLPVSTTVKPKTSVPTTTICSHSNWRAPEKNWSEPAKIWGEPARVWSEPAKVWGQPSKVWSEAPTTTTPRIQVDTTSDVLPLATKNQDQSLPRDESEKDRKSNADLEGQNVEDDDEETPQGTFYVLGDDEDEETLPEAIPAEFRTKSTSSSGWELPELTPQVDHSFVQPPSSRSAEIPESLEVALKRHSQSQIHSQMNFHFTSNRHQAKTQGSGSRTRIHIESQQQSQNQQQHDQMIQHLKTKTQIQTQAFNQHQLHQTQNQNRHNSEYNNRNQNQNPIKTNNNSGNTPTTNNNDDRENSGKKFGYVLDGNDVRKYRVEERTSDGYIVGEYGVLNNDNGFLRGVRYTADGTINPRLIHEALMKFLSL